jgi:hypothetical protein
MQEKHHKFPLSSTFALFEVGKSGVSWWNNVRRSAIKITGTMKG